MVIVLVTLNIHNTVHNSANAALRFSQHHQMSKQTEKSRATLSVSNHLKNWQRNMENMSSFRSLGDIPSKYHPIFSPIKHFNRVQSEVFDDVIKTSEFDIHTHNLLQHSPGRLEFSTFFIISFNFSANFLFFKEKHIVVSAPTGSGKTKIFELAIVELLMSLERTDCEMQNVKIVYGKH